MSKIVLSPGHRERAPGGQVMPSRDYSTVQSTVTIRFAVWLGVPELALHAELAALKHDKAACNWKMMENGVPTPLDILSGHPKIRTSAATYAFQVANAYAKVSRLTSIDVASSDVESL